NTREDFAADHPELVVKVLQAYEKARAFAIANPSELKRIITEQAKLTDQVAARQLERTALSTAAIGERQKKTIEGAGIALQQVGVVPADVNVPAAAAALVDSTFTAKLGIK
ncbi:MAG: aliphatic sulfonates ABC transporter substrate-binding protein, partial [Rhodospirillales bacterium]